MNKNPKSINFMITFRLLYYYFSPDTLWIHGTAEIIGYSPSTNNHIVISDGNCTSHDGKYLVQIYKPKDPVIHSRTWYNGTKLSDGTTYPLKYLVDETYADHVFEGRIDFTKIPENRYIF